MDFNEEKEKMREILIHCLALTGVEKNLKHIF